MKNQLQFHPSANSQRANWFALLNITLFAWLPILTEAQGLAGITVAGGNGVGSAANQLNEPFSVYMDAPGNIFIADSKNSRVQKFELGSTKESDGETVVGADHLSLVRGVFVDAAGNVFASDKENTRVQKFSFGSAVGIQLSRENPNVNRLFTSFVDAAGNTFVSEVSNHCVKKFLPGSATGIVVAGGKGKGAKADQLSSPNGIFVDVAGNLFIADTDNHRVQKFALNSATGLTVAGGNGNGDRDNQLSSPTGIFVDAAGNVFVADKLNHRIQKFPPIAIAITKQPEASNAICSGTNFDTSVEATSNATLSYRWYKDDVLLPSQTAATLTLTDVQQADAGSYKAVISGEVGTLASEVFSLKVNPSPILTTLKQPVIVSNGDSFTDISVTVKDGTASEFTYNWMPGDLTGSIVKVHPETTTTYQVTATDRNGCNSLPERVTVEVDRVFGASKPYAPFNSKELNDNEFNSAMKVFPNPLQNVATVEILSRAKGAAKFEVVDVLGRTVKNQTEQMVEGLNEVKMRLGTLTPGIYVIRYKDALNRQVTTRIIKE